MKIIKGYSRIIETNIIICNSGVRWLVLWHIVGNVRGQRDDLAIVYEC